MPDSSDSRNGDRGRSLLQGGYLPNLELGEPRRVSAVGHPGTTGYELDVCVRGDRVATVAITLYPKSSGAISMHSEIRREAPDA